MNKKGFLLGEESVKLILAVIAILFLILFIVFLYNNFSKNKDLELAESSLEYLIAQTESGGTDAEIYNPAEGFWYIVSFSSSQQIPEKCLDAGWSKCICICKDPTPTATGGPSQYESCDKYGKCASSDYDVIGQIPGKEFLGITITPPLLLSINHEDKTIMRKENGA